MARTKNASYGASGSRQRREQDDEPPRRRPGKEPAELPAEKSKDDLNLTPIKERPISFHSLEPAVIDYLSGMSWGKFCHEIPIASSNVVKEFYGSFSTYDQRRETVTVRGKKVKFGASEIAAYYGSQKYGSDAYFEYMNTQFDPAAILAKIGQDGAEWVPSRGKNNDPLKIRSGDLTDEARFWSLVVTSRLIPSLNKSEITMDRAALVFCLMSEKKIDLGIFLHAMIMKRLRDPAPRSIWFPSLITELCRTAGVEFNKEDGIIKPGTIIGGSSIKRIQDKRRNQEAPQPPQRAPRQIPFAPSLGAMTDFISYQRAENAWQRRHMRQMQREQARQAERSRQVTAHHEACYRWMAEQQGFDMALMPQLPEEELPTPATESEEDSIPEDDEEEDDAASDDPMDDE